MSNFCWWLNLGNHWAINSGLTWAITEQWSLKARVHLFSSKKERKIVLCIALGATISNYRDLNHFCNLVCFHIIFQVFQIFAGILCTSPKFYNAGVPSWHNPSWTFKIGMENDAKEWFLVQCSNQKMHENLLKKLWRWLTHTRLSLSRYSMM